MCSDTMSTTNCWAVTPLSIAAFFTSFHSGTGNATFGRTVSGCSSDCDILLVSSTEMIMPHCGFAVNAVMLFYRISNIYA